MRKRRPLLKRLFLAFLIVLVAALLVVWLLVRASLPQLDGTLAATVKAPVTIERDALGTATVHASNRNDAAWALGFVHAQERFFEMDLMRSAAAGELSELVGGAALKMDKDRRPFRMRARTAKVLAAIPAEDLAALEAYS